MIMNRVHSFEHRGRYVNHRKRQMIFRRVCLVLSIILSTFALIGAAGILSHAEDNDAIHYYKYYTSITVMPGDTLSSIASDYDLNYPDTLSHVDEIRYCNHLADDEIYAGSSLIVPYYSTEFVY